MSVQQPVGHGGAFVLGPARCGSTMLSRMLNLHPQILSVSEFLASQTTSALLPGQFSGQQYWDMISKPSVQLNRVMRPDTAPSEYLYDLDGGRWKQADVPAISAMTLPHISDASDGLLDQLGEEVPGWPTRPLAQHHQQLFEHLQQGFGHQTWVERSGASLAQAGPIINWFPGAKFVLMTRDARDIVLSIQAFKPMRVMVWTWAVLRLLGVNILNGDRPIGTNALLWRCGGVLSRLMPFECMLQSQPSLKLCAQFYDQMILQTVGKVAELPAQKLHVVRYEDLVKQPRQELSGLTSFLNVDADGPWLDQASELPRDTGARWRRLGAEDQSSLTAWTTRAQAQMDQLVGG